jgi:hypothetical protein
MLQYRARDRVPLDWATTQNNFGSALARLGERESGTARLEEAISSWGCLPDGRLDCLVTRVGSDGAL